MGKSVLRGNRVHLIKLAYESIDSYLQNFSKKIQSLLHVQDPQSERCYLNARIEQNVKFFYVIQCNEQTIGAIEIRDPGHTSQLYCWVNEQFWGTGCFQEAMGLVLREYKKQIDEEIISACIDEKNGRSVHALEKVGFKKIRARSGPFGKQIVLHLHMKDVR